MRSGVRGVHDQNDGFISRHPFASAFATILISILGGGLLSLPVALAYFTPTTAAVVVVAFGVINLITMVGLALAVSRSDAIARGRGGLSTMLSSHFGRLTARIISVVSIGGAFAIIVVYLFGLASALEQVLAVSRIVWLLLAGLLFTWIIGMNRRDLFARASSVIAVVNVGLVLIALVLMAVAALRSPVSQSYALDLGTLTYRPAVQNLIGVGFFVFYGHSTVFVVAPRVLRADPSGRSLVRGAATAMVVTMLITAAWVGLALSVVPGSTFMSASLLGITALGAQCGRLFDIVTTLFAILAFSLGTIAYGFYLADETRDLFARTQDATYELMAGDVLELIDGISGSSLTLVHSSMSPESLVARARSGRDEFREDVPLGSWRADQLLHAAGAPRRCRVTVVTSIVRAGVIAVRVSSTMTPVVTPARGSAATWLAGEGLEAQVLALLTRSPRREEELALMVGVGSDELEPVIVQLLDSGLISTEHGVLRAEYGQRRAVHSSITSGLPFDDTVVPAKKTRDDRTVRMVSALVTMLLCVAVASAVVVLGSSFTTLLDLSSVIDVLVLGAFLPPILGISLRRRAERESVRVWTIDLPGFEWALLISLVVLIGLYGAFVLEDRVVGALAVLDSVIAVVLIITGGMSGAFSRRSTINVDLDEAGIARVQTLDGGVSVPAVVQSVPVKRTVTVTVPSGLRAPILLLASQGDALPAGLSHFHVIAASSSASGELESLAGVEFELGQGPLVLNMHS